MAQQAEGTHMGGPRPRGGYQNTCAPEKRPGRKITKARQRLAARIAGYEETAKRMKNSSGYHRPGSMKCR